MINKAVAHKQPQSWAETYTRQAAPWVSIFSLYKPFAQVTALGLGSARTLSSLYDMKNATTEGTLATMSASLHTLFNAAAVAGTFFAHPMGMLMNAGLDLKNSSIMLAFSLQEGRYQDAMEHAGKIFSNALYVASFSVGGPQLRIATLALQITLGLYHAKKAYSEESYLEAAGHLVMLSLVGRELVQLTTPMQAAETQTTAPHQIKKATRGTHIKERPPVPEHIKSAPEVTTNENTYKVRIGVAQYGGSDYSNAVRVERGISVEEALKIADSNPEIDYFFRLYDGFTRMILPVPASQDSVADPLNLIGKPVRYRNDDGSFAFGRLRAFSAGDTVFFTRKPSEGDWGGMWLGSARGYSDTYVKL